MWIIFFLSRFFPLNYFGIIPRTYRGLLGIFTAPLLHSSWDHLISNTIALVTFVPIFITLEGKNVIEKIFLLTLLTGMMTWFFARSAIHIGASGLVFALYGHLIFHGFFKKKIFPIIMSILLLIIHGHMLFGIFPIQAGVSWESHFFGLIAGLILAKYK